MLLSEAIDITVAKTKHERFRELLDPSHPDYQPKYEGVVRAIAEGRQYIPGPAPVALPPSWSFGTQLRLKALAFDCLYAAQPGWRGCGCRGCYAKGTKTNQAPDASLRECLECVSQLVNVK